MTSAQLENQVTAHRVAQMRRAKRDRTIGSFHVTFDTLVFSAEEVAEKIEKALELAHPRTHAKAKKWSGRTKRWMTGYLSRK